MRAPAAIARTAKRYGSSCQTDENPQRRVFGVRRIFDDGPQAQRARHGTSRASDANQRSCRHLARPRLRREHLRRARHGWTISAEHVSARFASKEQWQQLQQVAQRGRHAGRTPAVPGASPLRRAAASPARRRPAELLDATPSAARACHARMTCRIRHTSGVRAAANRSSLPARPAALAGSAKQTRPRSSG